MSVPTPHLSAEEGDIAEVVLMPGDPKRARWIAQTYLDDARCYNEVRAMDGWTGTYRGVRLSVQAHGMGMPSLGIYATELFRFYGVRTAIRIGSCGAFAPHVAMRDVIVATAAHTDSALIHQSMRPIHFAPTASYRLLRRVDDTARSRGQTVHLGTVLTSDLFYDSDPALFERMRAHGTLGVEMETAALYAIASRHGVDAVSLLTVSDHLATNEQLSSRDRQLGLAQMVELALETAVSLDEDVR